MTSTRGRKLAYAPTLSPFPEGWYFVASRQEILKAKLIQKTWMGENVVVWCDENGRVCVAEAFCPHLGADLGPPQGDAFAEAALSVHSMAMNSIQPGQCVATPFADPPRPRNWESSRHMKLGA